MSQLRNKEVILQFINLFLSSIGILWTPFHISFTNNQQIRYQTEKLNRNNMLALNLVKNQECFSQINIVFGLHNMDIMEVVVVVLVLHNVI